MNSSHSSLLVHVVILIILDHLLVRKFSLVAEGKSLRLPSIPELSSFFSTYFKSFYSPDDLHAFLYHSDGTFSVPGSGLCYC